MTHFQHHCCNPPPRAGAPGWQDHHVRIISWNINGVVTRAERLLAYLVAAQPDVLCLQELKVPAEQFPYDEVQALGYEVEALGDGRWNGVALLSRVGICDVVRNLPGQPEFEGSVEPRAIGATCGGVRVWGVYVPNGREPSHAHYAYKLEWLAALRSVAVSELAQGMPWVVVGDFNVAPTDEDVWDRSLFENSTHVTEPERAAVRALADAGLVEVMPRALKYDKPFTFWDYRQLAFPKNNGMRIDLIFGSPSFAGAVTDAYVDRDERKPGKAGKAGGPKPVPPSDHAPVVVDVAL